MCNNNTTEEKQCGCGNHEHNHKDDCCGGNHEHNHGEDCGCESKGSGGCGCGGHDHEHVEQTVTIVLEDDQELECPVIDIFAIGEQAYIALFHPVDEVAMIYRFFENEDETIELDMIQDDEEFELVSKTFMSLNDEE